MAAIASGSILTEVAGISAWAQRLISSRLYPNTLFIVHLYQSGNHSTPALFKTGAYSKSLCVNRPTDVIGVNTARFVWLW